VNPACNDSAMTNVSISVLALAVVPFVACKPSKEIIPGVGPIAQFVRSEDQLSVYGNRHASKSDLVNLDVLLPYIPGVSIGTAVAAYGEPQRIIQEKRGERYIEYLKPQGRFRLGSEETGDGYVGHPLYFFPNDRRPAALLPRYILEKLRPSAEIETVQLFQCGYEQSFMAIVIEVGQVDIVIWEAEDDLVKRQSPDQCTD